MEKTNNNHKRLTAEEIYDKNFALIWPEQELIETGEATQDEVDKLRREAPYKTAIKTAKDLSAQEVAFETAPLKAQIDLLIESETKAQDERARLQQENLQLRKALSETGSYSKNLNNERINN